jgi:hypothetical protein
VFWLTDGKWHSSSEGDRDLDGCKGVRAALASWEGQSNGVRRVAGASGMRYLV